MISSSLFSGGLRGAVGIALAIALDNSVRSSTEDEEKRALTNKLFGMVGGVCLLTIYINGALAETVLDKLGLKKSSETHKKIMQHYDRLLKREVLSNYAKLMTDSRFCVCSRKIVRHHVEYLRDVTDKEVESAVQYAERRKSHDGKLHSESRQRQEQQSNNKRTVLNKTSLEKTDAFGEIELRLLFIELLRAAYEEAIKDGYLDPRVDNGFVYFTLTQSLDFAVDVVNRGGPIDDWRFTDFRQSAGIKRVIDRISVFTRKTRRGTLHLAEAPGDNERYQSKRINILRAFAFQEAHQFARRKFKSEFADAPDSLGEAADDNVEESKFQEKQAANVLEFIDKQELDHLVSHFVCIILLSKSCEFCPRAP